MEVSPCFIYIIIIIIIIFIIIIIIIITYRSYVSRARLNTRPARMPLSGSELMFYLYRDVYYKNQFQFLVTVLLNGTLPMSKTLSMVFWKVSVSSETLRATLLLVASWQRIGWNRQSSSPHCCWWLKQLKTDRHAAQRENGCKVVKVFVQLFVFCDF